MNISDIMNENSGTSVHGSLGPVRLNSWSHIMDMGKGPCRVVQIEDASHKPLSVLMAGEWVTKVPDEFPPPKAEGKAIAIIMPGKIGIEVTKYQGNKSLRVIDGSLKKEEKKEEPQEATKKKYHGAAVGMAINQACKFARANGKDLSTKEGIEYVRLHTSLVLKINDDYETY